MKPYYQDDLVTIYHGSALDVMNALDEPVDLIFTDPPYPKEFDYVWDELAVGAWRTLKPGGHLLTLLGHYQIPRVMDVLREVGLEYRWLCILPNKNQPIMHGWNIKVCFKPILWFTKGREAPTPRLMLDNLTARRGSFSTAKLSHVWGQPILAEPILALTEPGQIVLDPFMGSGTTLVGAKDMGRHAIGIEIEERYCEIAATRCAQEVLGLVAASPDKGICARYALSDGTLCSTVDERGPTHENRTSLDSQGSVPGHRRPHRGPDRDEEGDLPTGCAARKVRAHD